MDSNLVSEHQVVYMSKCLSNYLFDELIMLKIQNQWAWDSSVYQELDSKALCLDERYPFPEDELKHRSIDGKSIVSTQATKETGSNLQEFHFQRVRKL